MEQPGRLWIVLGVGALALAAAAQAQLTPAPGSPFAVGGYPAAVRSADLNGDGKADLVLVTDGVAVLLGDGSGGFTQAPGSPFAAVISGPTNVMVGDVNGDGKLDLVIAGGSGYGGVAVLLGDGTGHFALGIPTVFGVLERAVGLVDFDGDGRLELLTADGIGANNPHVYLWKGDGTGRFTRGAALWAGQAFRALAVGDLDGDGKPDLVISSVYAPLAVLFGNGSTTTIPDSVFPWESGAPPDFVVVADVNEDGKPDLVCVFSSMGALAVLQGDGTGHFSPGEGSPYWTGQNAVSPVVGDFNGDGHRDIAVIGDRDRVTVLLGDGTGWFTPSAGNPFAAPDPWSLAAADFNGDGASDLAIANQRIGTVIVLLGGPPTQLPLFSTPQGNPFPIKANFNRLFPAALAAGDFNGDGFGDLVISIERPPLMLGSGTGALTPGGDVDAGVHSPGTLAVADFNGDGKLDLAVGGTADRLSRSVAVLLGDGAGSFTAASGSPLSAAPRTISIAVGDFNGDGKPDLCVARSDNQVTVLLGDGTGGFLEAAGSPFALGKLPKFLAVGDFNRDGRLDLAIANSEDNTVTVLLGDGRGGLSLAPGSPFPAGSGPNCVAVGDFNSDGKLDLAVSDGGANKVTVLVGDGTGRFTPAPGAALSVGISPTWVVVGDFNVDGKADLATANNGDSTVTVLLGDGAGGFTALQGSPFLVSEGPLSLAIGDFNRDGRPDLAVGATGQSGTIQDVSTVTVLLNNIPAPVTLTSPPDKATGVSLAPALIWSAASGATAYDVYFGTSFPPRLIATSSQAAYAPGNLEPGVVYFWRVVARSAAGALTSATWSFATEIALPEAPVLVAPADAAGDALAFPTLLWQAAARANSYDVYFGTTARPRLAVNTAATTYAPAQLSPNTTYYWRVAARNAGGTTSSATRSFTTAAQPPAGLLFVRVPPCRVADTRNPDGEFGGPALSADSTRSFAIPRSACGIPDYALAYSLNVTVVPDGPLSYLTMWPSGQPQPWVSTLNSWGGTVVANAAIVPAGSDGSISVYATNPTHLVIDLNGYFTTLLNGGQDAFHAVAPCRIADTRGPAGPYGGPTLTSGETRTFAMFSSGCGLPSTFAYSLNVTAVPTGPLGYLSMGPSWAAPFKVSTLNSWEGTVVANAAIVSGSSLVSVFVSDRSDVVLDVNGYFDLRGGSGELYFYPVPPCRLADTRGTEGPFGGPIMETGETRSFAVPAGGCNIPSNAKAYSFNVTVVPDGVLSYLTAWPTGSDKPLVSTLNSFTGSVVANAAIVPAGNNGAISIYVTNSTQVILDIDGYFAP